MQKRIWFYVLILSLSICYISILVPPSDGRAEADETWIEHGDIALNQAVTDLTNNTTILCLAAHPDDEDGATLSYYRKRYGIRTAILYATRGEGGQNEIGTELYEELGVIRAYETQSAADVYGSEVYNLNKRDFGFSKSAEETFKIWGHDDSLKRLVRIIREIKPDVIITNHDTIHGHGNHQALGILALEAFDFANDASKFTDQIDEGLKTWQVKRLFLRCGKDDADVAINVGEYDQIRGYSYVQIANEGLKLHKSQGMGGNVERGPVYNYYKLIKSNQATQKKLNDLFDGLNDNSTPNTFIKDATSIQHDQITKDIISYIQQGNKIDAQEKLESVIAKSMDLYLTVKVDDNIVTRGQAFVSRVSLTNCNHYVIKGLKFQLQAPQGWIVKGESLDFQQLGYNETATAVFNVTVAENSPLTMPYADHLYDDSFMKPLIKGIVQYNAYDTPLSITSDATVDIIDDVEVHIFPKTCIIPVSSMDQTKRYVVNVINRLPNKIDGQIEVVLPANWKVKSTRQDFTLTEDQQAFCAFDVTIPSGTSPGDFSLDAKVVYNTKTIASKNKIRIIDVKVADGLNVGYVKSYDNTIDWALKQLNVRCNPLESDEIRFGNLSVYDTIILDIRAYLVRKDLIASNQRLLDYVRDGGNLIVMYNKTYEWNKNYAPYELELSSDRVTVEEAPITILIQDHPLFTFPNKITDEDWKDWIQERGLYFPSKWSPQYKELLSCNDPDEKPLRGGYLVASYGKGTYIYTSYVWYRQLLNLNSGAFRNFANMISLPKYASSLNSRK
jgi:LmbE family N-acetylglucosaminyl deacetylase